MKIVKIPIPAAEHIGVYAIRNKRSGKVYIGSASNISARLEQHEAEIRLRNGINMKMQEDIQDYLEVEFVILATIPDGKITASELTHIEYQYIKWYDAVNKGYNIRHGGGSNLGRIKSETILYARKRKQSKSAGE